MFFEKRSREKAIKKKKSHNTDYVYVCHGVVKYEVGMYPEYL